jgi:hemerythrin-like domain-containing protein
MNKSLIHVAPGFDDPIGLLRACHLRIQQRCALLDRIIEHLGKHGADEQARTACRQILHYFSTSGKQHHEDEECDLFPAMLAASSGPKRKKIQQVIDGLEADHVVMAQAWADLEPALKAIEAGTAQTLDSNLSDRFQTAYIAHIEREEVEAFDVAAKILDSAELERIGRCMAARRGVDFPLG